jgi:hypothetical protein
MVLRPLSPGGIADQNGLNKVYFGRLRPVATGRNRPEPAGRRAIPNGMFKCRALHLTQPRRVADHALFVDSVKPVSSDSDAYKTY